MTTRTLDLEPLDATFGASVRGIELRSLDAPTWQMLHEAWLDCALLIFPGQFLTQDEQNNFARRFGELEFPAAPISNIGKDGVVHSASEDDIVKSIRGNEGWHHDSTYMPVQAKGAVFSAEIIPTEGAATGFADMCAAYDALDEETRLRVSNMSAYHSLEYSQGRPATSRRSATWTAAMHSTATAATRRSYVRSPKCIRRPAGRTCSSVAMPMTSSGSTERSPKRCSTTSTNGRASRPGPTTTNGRSATRLCGTTVA